MAKQQKTQKNVTAFFVVRLDSTAHKPFIMPQRLPGISLINEADLLLSNPTFLVLSNTFNKEAFFKPLLTF
jgi:hypothetical protein